MGRDGHALRGLRRWFGRLRPGSRQAVPSDSMPGDHRHLADGASGGDGGEAAGHSRERHHAPWPPRTGNPPIFNIPPATLVLIGTLVVVYSFLNLFPDRLTWPVLVRLTFLYGDLDAMLSGGYNRAAIWTLTSLFTHGLVHLLAMHLMVNLGFLMAFGSAVERVIGPKGMLTVFFLSVAAGAIAQFFFDSATSGALMGASGGVSGCMGCFARLMLRRDTHPQMRRMGLNLIGVLVLVNLAIGFFGEAVFGGAFGGSEIRIAWQAHIGGFAAGLALGSIPWPRPRRRSLWRES